MGEKEKFAPGEPPGVFELKGIKMGVIICYELRFPELFWSVAKDSHVVIVPASWPASRIEHWRTLLRARAIESSVYVIGVNAWGETELGFMGGHSAVVSPTGEVQELGEGYGVLEVTIDVNEVIKTRSQFVAYKDRLRIRQTLSSPDRPCTS